jgi:hypothetical protein
MDTEILYLYYPQYALVMLTYAYKQTAYFVHLQLSYYLDTHFE